MHSTSNTQSIPREEMEEDGHEGALFPALPAPSPSAWFMLLLSLALPEEDVTVMSHFCRDDVALSPLKGQ